MSENKQQVTMFLDMLGRTIIGVLNAKKTTEKNLAIDNPAVLNIVPTQQGSMQVQIIPLVFREIQADRDQDVTWNYNRSHVTESENLVPSFQITSQYQNVTSATPVAPAQTPPPAVPGNEEVIKLFDD